MTTRARINRKGAVVGAFVAIICVGCMSCTGAVSRPPQNDDSAVGADLEATAPSVSDDSPSVGGRSTLSATVRNVGARSAAATTLRFYRSDDPTITTSDTEEGSAAVAELAASGSASASLELVVPATPGTYYYGACVDAVPDETDTTNNCSAAERVTVGTTAASEHGQPDLMVTPPTVSDSSPSAGAQFTVSATVQNAGRGSAAATTLRYFRSSDPTITTSDDELGEVTISALAASGSASGSLDSTAPETPGTYYYGACVDAVTGETDTTNNCSASVQATVQVTVSEPSEPQGDPDLTVTSASVSNDGPAPGAKFTLSATVRNGGDGTSAATTLRYYRSNDATITTSDTAVETHAVGQLAASGSISKSVELTAPATPGTYYYGACVDTVTDESDATNNCSGSVPVTVTESETEPDGQGPTVEVSAEDDKEWAPVGYTVDLSARVLDDEGEEITATFSWSSSNTAVATVDSSGVMTAVGEGSVTLTATATVSGSTTISSSARTFVDGARRSGGVVTNSEDGMSGSIDMTVVKTAARIVVTPATLSFDELGAEGSKTLTATVYDADDNVMQPTYWGWSSADRGVADVSPRTSYGVSAEVKAIGPGTTTVTVSANGSATGTATVTVTLTGRRVEVSPTLLTFDALGDTKTVTVKVLNEDGTEDTSATWSHLSLFAPQGYGSIGDGGLSIATVDGGLNITANGTGKGGVSIASADAKTALVSVTVDQVPASLKLSPESLSLKTGDTGTLTASVLDANEHEIQLADSATNRGGLVVSWATSDSAVATVEAYGDLDSDTETGHSATVTAAGAGTATITGSWGSDISDTVSITVTN